MFFDCYCQSLISWREIGTRLCLKFEIFLIFSNFLRSSLKVFGNSWGNSYTKFVILDIKVRFTCGKSDLYWNIVEFYNIFIRIVWKCSFCSLQFQWWFKFVEKEIIWFKNVSSIKQLWISKVEKFLKLSFDLNQIR